ncbi:Mov34/MPN/PAD-1 family protein [Sphingopyxis panaciterrulae]|uniref:Integrative and conjugative element protein (TIGR02256 family) n=1 Tax=Sphingopyxis panaciterrulae TaxID=462372 RepID=A0A7W9EQ82_9SPHN|nr:Mov34/MPN/PAD-1 family protein [Sphingopyxis panaciterrulae]MBB5706348.1 integrative and conjugative element protein (TIGR02256 family) [Sphingopyxis panaciterrulae]
MTIWLAREVVLEMERLGSIYYPLETGGMLLGWRDGPDRIATGLIGPGSGALHGLYSFIPDGAWQRARLAHIFSATAGDLDYLGDWHTHPDGVAAMSEVDRRTLSKIERRVRDPLMVILAGAASRWDMGAWFGTRPGYWGRLSASAAETRIFDAPTGWPVLMEVS